MATFSPVRSSSPCSAVARICSTRSSTVANWARMWCSSKGGQVVFKVDAGFYLGQDVQAI